jgi:PAS domain-containing protein
MPDDRLVFIGYNTRAVEMLATDHEALLGKTLEEAFPGNIGTTTPDAYRKVAREGGTWSTDQYAYDAGKIAGVFEVYAFSFGPNRVSVFFRDITDLRRAEVELQNSEAQLRTTVDKLADTARTLKALSACNEALVRAESEQQLLQQVCEIAVGQGGYRLAWVGYAEHDEAKTVTPVAFAGAEDGYLTTIHITWDGASSSLGPGGTVIKTGEPVLIESIVDDPRFVPWRDDAVARGYGSIAAFPLTFKDGQTIGAVMFYTGQSAGFDQGEIALLAELASDLAYGIETLRARATRDEMAAELAASNNKLQALLRQVTVSLGRVVEARDPYTSGHEERVAGLAKQIAEILTKPSALSPIEIRLIREHSQSGYDILKDISFAWPVADIVLQHHERMDGSGYPQGLLGAGTLPLARILSVADVVEAMASHRPYRAAVGLEPAVAEVSNRPDLYDPEVAAACMRLYKAGAINM